MYNVNSKCFNNYLIVLKSFGFVIYMMFVSFFIYPIYFHYFPYYACTYYETTIMKIMYMCVVNIYWYACLGMCI